MWIKIISGLKSENGVEKFRYFDLKVRREN